MTLSFGLITTASEVTRTIVEDKVLLHATPDTTTSVYAIEEMVPPGAIPSTMDHGGSFDQNSGKIKWGPFFDNTERILSYQFELPSNADGTLKWSGIGSFDGSDLAITGDDTLVAIGDTGNAPLFIQRTISSDKVALVASPPTNTQVYAIEETVPEGVTPEDISDGGAFDPASRKIKWGPFFDNSERTLTYHYQTASDVIGTLTWSGIGSLDGSNATITGDEVFVIPGLQLNISRIPDAPTFFLVSWQSAFGQSYLLEATESLDHPWESYLDTPTVADGPITVLTIEVEADTHFFRVTRSE